MRRLHVLPVTALTQGAAGKFLVSLASSTKGNGQFPRLAGQRPSRTPQHRYSS
jgi:hypothetical protein